MCQVSFSIPNDVIYARNITTEEANKLAQIMFVIALYNDGGMDLPYAAQIAGVTEKEFSDALSKVKGQSTEDAMDWLLSEIDKGIRSGKEKGWLTEEEMDRRFERRREKVLAARKA